MTKIEMLEKLALIREAVAALPNDARPISVTVSGPYGYIQISLIGETPEATSAVEIEGDSGPHKEYRADFLGVPVVWLGP